MPPLLLHSLDVRQVPLRLLPLRKISVVDPHLSCFLSRSKRRTYPRMVEVLEHGSFVNCTMVNMENTGKNYQVWSEFRPQVAQKSSRFPVLPLVSVDAAAALFPKNSLASFSGLRPRLLLRPRPLLATARPHRRRRKSSQDLTICIVFLVDFKVVEGNADLMKSLRSV